MPRLASTRSAHRASSPPMGGARAKETFPTTLYRLLETQGVQHAIAWQDAGACFLVHDETALEALLPAFWRHNSYSSMQRQLHIYGFSKLQAGPFAGCFAHPGFRRDRPDLLPHMHRIGDKKTRARKGLTTPLTPEGMALLQSPPAAGSMAAAPTGVPLPASVVVTMKAAPPAWRAAPPAQLQAQPHAQHQPWGSLEQMESEALPSPSHGFFNSLPAPPQLQLQPSWEQAFAEMDEAPPAGAPQLQRQGTSLDLDALEGIVDMLPAPADFGGFSMPSGLSMTRQMSFEAVF